MRSTLFFLIGLALSGCDTASPSNHGASTGETYDDGYADGYADAKAEGDESLAALESRLAAVEASLADLQNADPADLGELGELAEHLTVEEDGKGHADVILSGVNLHVQDGSGYTNGQALGILDGDYTANGYGNVIIGYDESNPGDQKTGSHNLIVGPYHSYTAVGAVVAGYDNYAAGSYSVLSGYASTVYGTGGVALGGSAHVVEGDLAAVVGGYHQTVDNDGGLSLIVGGSENAVTGLSSTLVGGQGLTLAGDYQYLSPALP